MGKTDGLRQRPSAIFRLAFISFKHPSEHFGPSSDESKHDHSPVRTAQRLNKVSAWLLVDAPMEITSEDSSDTSTITDVKKDAVCKKDGAVRKKDPTSVVAGKLLSAVGKEDDKNDADISGADKSDAVSSKDTTTGSSDESLKCVGGKRVAAALQEAKGNRVHTRKYLRKDAGEKLKDLRVSFACVILR